MTNRWLQLCAARRFSVLCDMAGYPRVPAPTSKINPSPFSKAREKLGVRGKGRSAKETNDGFVLRRDLDPYGPDFGLKNRLISRKNGYFWNGFGEISDS